jgi:probable phosphoglycerate mutase
MNRSNKMAPPAGARLFSESQPAPPPAVSIANIDGASRGNPGPASYAVVIRDPAGKIILELAKKLGRETNNVAEYYALLAALDYAVSHNISALRIRSDSELLVRQVQGRYKVKSAELKPLHERATKLARQLSYFAIEHVRREENRDADALANVALDSGSIVSASNLAPADEKQPSRTHDPKLTPSGAIKARFVRGVLVPSEPLDLPEGMEVSVTLHRPPRL